MNSVKHTSNIFDLETATQILHNNQQLNEKIKELVTLDMNLDDAMIEYPTIIGDYLSEGKLITGIERTIPEDKESIAYFVLRQMVMSLMIDAYLTEQECVQNERNGRMKRYLIGFHNNGVICDEARTKAQVARVEQLKADLVFDGVEFEWRDPNDADIHIPPFSDVITDRHHRVDGGLNGADRPPFVVCNVIDEVVVGLEWYRGHDALSCYLASNDSEVPLYMHKDKCNYPHAGGELFGYSLFVDDPDEFARLAISMYPPDYVIGLTDIQTLPEAIKNSIFASVEPIRS